MTWDSPLYTTFFRWQHYEDWIVTTQATHLWQHYNDFCTLIFNACAHVVVSHPGPWMGCRKLCRRNSNKIKSQWCQSNVLLVTPFCCQISNESWVPKNVCVETPSNIEISCGLQKCLGRNLWIALVLGFPPLRYVRLHVSALTRLQFSIRITCSRDMHFQKPWPFKCQMVGQSQACMPVDVPFAAQKTSYSTNVANDFFLRQRLHLRHQLALLFPPQRQLLGVGQLAGSLQARDEVGHFYPGGPGIATEEAKSKPSSWVYIMANTITISHTGFCTLFAHRWVREHLGGKQDCRNSKAVWLRKLKANAALIALLHLPFPHWDGIHSFPLTLCHCRRLVTSLARPKVLTSATPAATIAFSKWNRCVGDDISCKPAEFHV